MEVFESKQNVGCVESGCVLLKPSDLGEIEKELSAWAVFKHKEKFGLGGEGVIHLNYEWMSDRTLARS